MCRYIILLKYTDQGLANVQESLERADAFTIAAAKVGASVDGRFWTLGKYDGILILNAPDEATAAGLILGLGRKNNVTTHMLRAFDEEEFQEVLGQIG